MPERIPNATPDAALEGLLDRVAGGDEQAMTALYERERSKILRLFLRLGRCEHLAADLLQGTFLSLWRYRRAVRRRRSGPAYLYKIALNEWRRTAAREKRAREGWAVASDEKRTAESSAAEPPERAIVAEEERAAVRREIERLPDEQREVFVLHRFEELSCREIAEATGESVKTIESRLRLALLKLTRQLEVRKDLR